MRVYLDQIGCRLNYSEMETLAGRLRSAGHHTVTQPEQAQVIVFNSCAVTVAAERDSRKRIRQLHRRTDGCARIAVTGCLATFKPDALAALPGVKLVTPNPQKDMLHTLLEPWSVELDDPADLQRMQPDGNPFDAFSDVGIRQERTRAFVKVQDGCNNRCTFCIVTALRGESRSRALHEIVVEIQQLVEAGHREVVLTGVHLGSYGRDLPQTGRADLKKLVTTILAETDIRRVRLSSLEPWELVEGFFELWARWPHRLCPHLHLPLQAGTDRQLRRMGRRCTADSFRHLVETARNAIPGLILTTDLIAGFPGESEADFQAGLVFVEAMNFAHAHIFPFSAREGTAAARYGQQVAPEIKKARVWQLHRVIERTGRLERLRHLGTLRPVLWEGTGQPLQDRPELLWTGYTDNFLRVMAIAPRDRRLHNQITDVYLSALDGDTFDGEIVANPF